MEWLDGAKCAVCLTFDLDADISWRNILRRHKIERDNPVIMSQGQYGPKVGVPRILKLLKRYNLKAGFFIPGEVAERYPDTVMEISRGTRNRTPRVFSQKPCELQSFGGEGGA